MSSCKGGENNDDTYNDDHVLCSIWKAAWIFLKSGLERIQDSCIPYIPSGHSAYDDIRRAFLYSIAHTYNSRNRRNGSQSMISTAKRQCDNAIQA